MKKALSVLLVIAMSLTLFCACSDNKTKEKTEGDFSYVALEDNTAKITKFNKTDDIITLEIPATLGDMTVTVIGEGVFADAGGGFYGNSGKISGFRNISALF